ncbi:probable cytochrome P450 313a4 [Drosophila albomicans]|uniref:Probable cytochrome P450 313a4 n=1 Tax=Drosophila albomicans TaxID=7291 RepID=A0A6P8XRA8_DROAB|nr:probable cytochrome P450 313a4 [Drosophila albomicans]
MITWQLWCTLLCVLWFYFLWTRRRYYKLIFQIPGPVGYPLVGTGYKMRHNEEVLLTFKHYLDKHGPSYLFWLGPLPYFITTDPQLIQDIFNSPHCINKGFVYKALEDVAGQGLFTAKEQLWSVHRKLFNPVFAHKMLLSFIPIFNAETANLLKTVDKLVDCGGHNMLPVMHGFSLDITSQTTMGSDVKYCEYIRTNKLIEAFQSLADNVTAIGISPWLLSKTVRILLGKEEEYSRAKLEIKEFLEELIDSKLAKGSEAADKNIFVNIAIDMMNRGLLTKNEVIDESITIVFAAFETTANTITYALILLAMFPEYQEKAFEEIRALFPNTGDFEVTYGDTQNMVYLDLIINESMRVLSPGPLVARQTTKEVRLSNGVVLPRGIQIAIDIFHLHRDKNLWGENAETFDPDHFLPHNMQDKHPYSFIPFTKGIRNCIGWRYGLIAIKVAMAKLLRNYKFSTSFKFEDLRFCEHVTLSLETVPLLEVQRRDY